MIKIFRICAILAKYKVPFFPRILYAFNRIVFSVVLPPTVKVGSNVVFAYQGLGTIVHARSTIGSNVYIGPSVIIGGRSGHHQVPEIGDDVFIGAGARIFGPVKVGNGATVGAASVVLSDVAAGTTVVGIPARTIQNARKESTKSTRFNSFSD